MTQDQPIKRALRILDRRMRNTSALSSPSSVRDYLRILLHDRGHEVFVVVFMDAQHRVIASEELFRGTLTQTSVYPREVVKAALAHNAASILFAHNHPLCCFSSVTTRVDVTSLKSAPEHERL